MQPNNKHIDDLDYLANLGFEKNTITDADLNELHSKIKTKAFSYNNGLYFSFISLVVGVFIGVSCFFTLYNQPKNFTSKNNLILKDSVIPVIKNITPTIILDTIKLQHENFINPQKTKFIDTLLLNPNNYDSLNISTIQPIVINTLSDKNINATNIKYIPNSSVIYIHDLKITNYSLLYFKKNEQVLLTNNAGLSANYSATKDINNQPLKQNANYYLHEAIAEAMLYYKKANYNQCINSLNTLYQYNKEDINCKFYYGMCYYNKNNFAEAKKLFEDCIASPNNTFLQEAQYYNALCLIELGDIAEAKTQLKQIVEDAEFYSQKALLKLSELK